MADTIGEVVLLLTRIVSLQPVEPEEGLGGGNITDSLDRAFEVGRGYGRWEASQLALEALKLFAPSAVLKPKELPKEGP